MKKSSTTKGESPSRLIDARIKELDDWRGMTLSHVRALIKQADPEVVEEWKWSVPVWSHDGLICTGETYKSALGESQLHGALVRLAGADQSIVRPNPNAPLPLLHHLKVNRFDESADMGERPA